MAQCSRQLSAAQISKVTDIISADNSFRFCVEYLGIDRNQYKTREHDAKFKHHDILFECITLWRHKTERKGLDTTEQLFKLLTTVQEERSWFSKQDLASIFDGEIVTSLPSRKYCIKLY